MKDNEVSSYKMHLKCGGRATEKGLFSIAVSGVIFILSLCSLPYRGRGWMLHLWTCFSFTGI